MIKKEPYITEDGEKGTHVTVTIQWYELFTVLALLIIILIVVVS